VVRLRGKEILSWKGKRKGKGGLPALTKVKVASLCPGKEGKRLGQLQLYDLGKGKKGSTDPPHGPLREKESRTFARKVHERRGRSWSTQAADLERKGEEGKRVF